MKTQDMMDSLLALGVKRRKLTCQELDDAFPAEFYPLDELERFLDLLDELGVKVIESDKHRERKYRRVPRQGYYGDF